MKNTLDTSLAYKYFMSYRLYDGQRFDEIIVPYTPHRGYQRRMTAFLKKAGRKLIVSLVALFVLLSAFHLNLFVVAFLAVAGCVPLALAIFACMSPTHLALSPGGVRFYHIHWFGDKSSKIVPWKKIEVATISRGKSLGLQEEWLDFRGFDGSSASRIRLAGIAQGEHRRRLLAAVKQFVPLEKVDVHLQDSLNPVKISSHTDLWLEVLGSSPRRLRDGMLPEQTLVANGRYRVVSPLGVGGQGTVYLGEILGTDASSAPQVVLKEFVLPAEASKKVNRKAFQTIEKEAELLRSISHPQVVNFLDMFVDDHRAYLVLEHVPGKNLREVIGEHGPMPEATVIELAMQMCDVLIHLHGCNPPVVHRDFTPDNLILQPDGVLKLIDFNVALQLESTATRTVVGKHSYISPEQFRGKACPQSDLYSMGATLYYLLTGEDPEPISCSQVRAARADVSQALAEVIARATQMELEDRVASAIDLKSRLTAISS